MAKRNIECIEQPPTTPSSRGPANLLTCFSCREAKANQLMLRQNCDRSTATTASLAAYHSGSQRYCRRNNSGSLAKSTANRRASTSGRRSGLGRSLQDLIGFLSELHALHIDLLLLHGRSERCRRQDAEQMVPGIALRSKSKAS
jgi:hypothetical protein